MKKNPTEKIGIKKSWKISFIVLLGILSGLGGFTFYYARGTSYFSDDPQSCKNCHVMREQFDSWNHSSHKNAATCNGCHTPKDLVGKYAIKGLNGWNHSLAFTTGDFPEPIQIRKLNAKIVQKNCIRCHETLTGPMNDLGAREKLDCISCHGNVGHRTRL
jgi:cytochrome c nitrite reductase small subunit